MSVENDKIKIQKSQAIVRRIKKERDKQLAYLDRRIINSSINELFRVEAAELDELFQDIKQMLDKYHIFYYGEPPVESVITEDALAYFGPEWLEYLFDLARKALDDDSIEYVSDRVKQIRIRRKVRLSDRELAEFRDKNPNTKL